MAGVGREAAIVVGKEAGVPGGPMRTPAGEAGYIGRRAAVSRAVTPGARKWVKWRPFMLMFMDAPRI
jgi:hypothetical protein